MARAELHRHALHHNIEQTFADEANLIPLRAELDAGASRYILKIKSVPDLEPVRLMIGLSVGDIVHNLRGALDHAFWQLACVRWDGTPPHPRRVQFPMDDDSAWFNKRPVKDDLRSDDWDLIDWHQPYRGEDGRPDTWHGPYVHPLALLRDLTDHDKHRITTAAFVLPSGFSLPGLPGVVYAGVSMMGFFPVQDHMEVGTGVAWVRVKGVGAKPEINSAGKVTPQVALAERRPLIPTIDRLTSRVDLILGEIEGRFP